MTRLKNFIWVIKFHTRIKFIECRGKKGCPFHFTLNVFGDSYENIHYTDIT